MIHGYTWTDWFFLGLLLFAIVWFAISLRDPTTQQAFRHLGRQKLAVGFGLVLLFFFCIAILDCIHIQKNSLLNESETVLDYLLAPLDNIEEKTFSAPLALVGYTKETTYKEGQYQSFYPKLKYPAHTIHNIKERNYFIKKQFIIALLSSLLTGFMLWLIGVVFARWRYHVPIHSRLPAYHTFWITAACMVFVVVLFYGISRQLHVFGTGKIGQDIFYYSIKSVRTGLVISILTTLFTLPFALFLGVAAGYFGGWIDDLIQFTYTTLSSIPGVLLITASVLSMQTFIANHPDLFTTLSQQADARLLALCLILGVTSWTSLCRLLRAEAMRLREIDFVLAARALGVSSFKILRRHLLPNVTHIVMITLVLDFSYLILAEAILTYVGVGVSPMTISWGNMINSARLELAREPIVWWPVLAAFSMMFTLVLASNVFADAVETAWNPRTREG